MRISDWSSDVCSSDLATVRDAISHFGSNGMRPGDVYITNNPWKGTGHLNDVTLVKPIFHGDKLVAFAATAAHVPDIGGKIRSVDARELFEEGFHIRSETRRVGKECVSTCRSWWSPEH